MRNKKNREFSKYYNFGIFSKIIYTLSRFLFWLFVKFFIRLKVKTLISFPLKKPLILASNHLSFLDPFLLCICFPFNSRVHFIRFMTADVLMKKFGFIIKRWGCFPTFHGRGLNTSLKIPKKIIEQGNSLLIFPRGKRIKRLHKRKSKVGTAILALTNNTPILPIKIIDSHPGSLKKLFLRKRQIKIIIGKPFLLNEQIGEKNDYTNDDFRKATEIIVKEIGKLQF